MNEAEDLIPQGLYCYGIHDLCPFWSLDHTQPYQMNGYCLYIGKGDWELQGIIPLLWDQVKECGINDEDFEEPEPMTLSELIEEVENE